MIKNVTAKNAIEAMHKTSEKFSQDMRETTKDAVVMEDFCTAKIHKIISRQKSRNEIFAERGRTDFVN